MSLPEVLLFTAPGCPHCPGVKAALEKLRAEGVIGALEVISVPEAQERAAALGVRSVPWLRIGEFVLTGAQTPAELRHWAERAGSEEGLRAYLTEMLASGQLATAENLVARLPSTLAALLPLIAETDTPIQVRLGIGALLEGVAGTPALTMLIPELTELSRHPDHRVRADACHYLGLSADEAARAPLTARLEDAHPEVREIAAEALEDLNA